MTADELEEKYPDLFEKCYDFSIRAGWMPLIETFCQLTSNEIATLKQRIETIDRCMINPPPKITDWWSAEKPRAEEKLAWYANHPVKIVQIKEKFAGLRLCCEGGTDKERAWARFAEELSYKICEDCGRPSEATTRGWMRTLCLECAKKSGREYTLKTK